MKTLLILLIIFSSGLKPYEGKILRIIDGDTFVLQTEEGNLKIRMDGIDAPEMDQEFGLEAKEFLNRFLYKNGRVYPKELTNMAGLSELFMWELLISTFLRLEKVMPGTIKSIRVIRSWRERRNLPKRKRKGYGDLQMCYLHGNGGR